MLGHEHSPSREGGTDQESCQMFDSDFANNNDALLRLERDDKVWRGVRVISEVQ